MGKIYLHPQYNKFRRFLAVFAGLNDLSEADLFVYENSGYKTVACYAARKYFDFTDAQLSEFFQIYIKFLNEQLEAFAVQILVDPVLKEGYEWAWKMHNQLELTYSSYGVEK
ncbi:hypothetical protein [Leeuwenhoekiella sp. LLG6367-2.1]|uniref:hypothetical protein n=1 Tax=Leeuwenhoekiella sp. LLG6367-2.1 TaxID=3160833 RepID=UPI00386C94DD